MKEPPRQGRVDQSLLTANDRDFRLLIMKTNRSLHVVVDDPKPVAEGVWIINSTPISIIGLHLPIRMTAIRLANGSLLLYSPTRFGLELQQKLEEIGPIKHLVAPNSAHWIFMKEWQAHLPEAVTWAAPGLRQRSQVRRSGLRLDHDLGEAAPDIWWAEIDQVVVPGLGGFAEVAFFHKASRTLMLTDLVQNLEPNKLPRLIRPLARLAGVTAPDGKAPIYLRAIVKLKGRAARDAAHRLLMFRPNIVIFSHGRWFDRDGTTRLQKSLAWLL